jgi:hypothetical protein
MHRGLVALPWYWALGSILISGVAFGQESVPSEPLMAIKKTMMELQTGAWSVESAKTVIETLIAHDRRAAARWWVQMSEDAMRARKLPTNAQASLTALRKRCEDLGASEDDRKVLLKALRHLEAVVSARNFDEARTVASGARALLILAPDPTLSRIFEAAEKKITAKGNHDPSNLSRLQKQFAELRPSLTEAINRRLDRAQIEYQEAGCPVGRAMMRTAIRSASPEIGAARSRSRLQELRATALEVEPSRSMSVLVVPIDGHQVLHNEVEVKPEPDVRKMRVVADDVVQVVVGRFGTGNLADGKSHFHLAALNAQLDGKELDPGKWLLNLSDDPAAENPKTAKIQMLRIRTRGEPVWKKLGIDSAICGDAGAFLSLARSNGLWTATSASPQIVEIERAFESKKLPFQWVGDVSETCIIRFTVPSG